MKNYLQLLDLYLDLDSSPLSRLGDITGRRLVRMCADSWVGVPCQLFLEYF